MRHVWMSQQSNAVMQWQYCYVVGVHLESVTVTLIVWRQHWNGLVKMCILSFMNFFLRLSPWKGYWVFVLEFLHGVWGEFSDDVSGPTADPETSSKFTLRTVQNLQNQKSRVTGHESERSDLWRVKTGPIAVPETSSGNSPSSPCKSPKTKNHVTGHESDRTFWLMTSEDGSHSGSRNVVGKFTSHTVQKLQNQKSTTFFFVLPVLWHV
jgi:hypothetical protein